MSRDIEELTALNRDYVASVQNSDVERFDHILAADFYCSNPDKSLVDRAAFLKQTAAPVTIRNLTAHDVKIRVLGDFAIIHAATSYTTADGSTHDVADVWFAKDVQPQTAEAAPTVSLGDLLTAPADALLGAPTVDLATARETPSTARTGGGRRKSPAPPAGR